MYVCVKEAFVRASCICTSPFYFLPFRRHRLPPRMYTRSNLEHCCYLTERPRKYQWDGLCLALIDKQRMNVGRRRRGFIDKEQPTVQEQGCIICAWSACAVSLHVPQASFRQAALFAHAPGPYTVRAIYTRAAKGREPKHERACVRERHAERERKHCVKLAALL